MAEELKREFANIEDAFNSLPVKQQEHGKRVGEYLKVMFLQACSQELYAYNAKAVVRFKDEYSNLMMLIGRYHDLGKVLVPEEYHTYNAVFSPEETALFKKHASDSAKLVRQLLEKENRYRALELNFVEEALAGHHEQWDGQGFPANTKGENISVLARLVTVADALDHISVEKRSEQPLEFAIEQIKAGAGTLYDPNIVDMIPSVKGKIKRVFNSHIAQTRAIPTTETFIKRRANRPFELWYRPITGFRKDSPEAFEAFIRFRNKKEWMDYPDVEALIRREKLGPDMGTYMLLEACDTINRLDACGIQNEYMTLELPYGWLNRRGAWKDVQQVIADTQVAANRLCIDLGERTIRGRTQTMVENVKKLREIGCGVLLSKLETDVINKKKVDELCPTMLRITTENLDNENNFETLKAISDAGVMLMAQDIVKKKYQPVMSKLKVRYTAGNFIGEAMRENDLVEHELAAQEGEIIPMPTQKADTVKEEIAEE